MATTLQIVNGDVVETDDGQFATVSGPDCIKQCIGESLTIQTQPNGFGAGLVSLVGQVPQDELAMQMLVVNNVTNNFRTIRLLQKIPDRTPRATNEIVSGSVIVSSQVDPKNPRRYAYSAKILTESGLAFSAKGQIPF